MTRNNRLKSKILIFSLFTICTAFSFADNFVVSAVKFELTKGQDSTSLLSAATETVPQSILTNLGSSLTHSIMPDEEYERTLYTLNTTRNSLYLQLNAAYKKRDAIFLNDFSDYELKQQLKTEEKTIKEIEEKLEENTKAITEAQTKRDLKQEQLKKSALKNNRLDESELEKYSSLFRNMFTKNEDLISSEDIAYYKNDSTVLYKLTNKDKAYDSPEVKNEVTSAKINSLITGKITSYGSYISVTAEAFIYPSGKSCGSVTKLGSIKELEFICSEISREIVPLITNSLPVTLSLSFKEAEAENFQFFIDDVLQSNVTETIKLDSGKHKIQLTAEGYNSPAATYYFEGNRHYLVEVTFEKINTGEYTLSLFKPVPGGIYANGVQAENPQNGEFVIKVNGDSILGEFSALEGGTDFFYITEDQLAKNNNFKTSLNLKDKGQYIDSRRKWMYGAYSAFIISLIPTFYTSGTKQKYVDMYNSKVGDYETAVGWNTAWQICTGISIGTGVFWAYELIRYLIAADSVLPEKVKADKNKAAVTQSKKSEADTESENEVSENEVLDADLQTEENSENNITTVNE